MGHKGDESSFMEKPAKPSPRSAWCCFSNLLSCIVDPRRNSAGSSKWGGNIDGNGAMVSADGGKPGSASGCCPLWSKLSRGGGWMLLFLVAYCAQPLLVDLIRLNGGAHSSTFLFLLPHYGSMMLIGLLPKKVPLRECDWKTAFILSSLDIVNQMLKKAGLVFAGAAVYIVIDSSSIVWTAVWSVILLKRRLSILQWISIGLIFCGVAMKACLLEFSFKNDEFIGVVFISVAAMSMGLNFVLSEHFMRRQQKPIPGPNLVCMMGTFCTSFLTVWTVVWTLPRFDALVKMPIQIAGGSKEVIFIAFAVLLVTSLIHSSTFWYIIKHMGAVSSGVLKGLKVASVFILSHIFFCSESRPKQCLTPSSALSAIVCVSGVILYSTVTARLHTKRKEEVKLDEEEEELVDRRHGPAATGGLSGTMQYKYRHQRAPGDLSKPRHGRRLPRSIFRVESDEGLVHNSSMIFTHAAHHSNSGINNLSRQPSVGLPQQQSPTVRPHGSLQPLEQDDRNDRQ